MAFGCPENCHLVLLGVSTEEELKLAKEFLDDHKVDSKIFYEPDIEGFTAICSKVVYGKDRRIFRDFEFYS